MEEKFFNEKIINKIKIVINKVTSDEMEKKFIRARIINNFETFFNLNNAKSIYIYIYMFYIKYCFHILLYIIDQIKLAKEMARKRKISDRQKLVQEIAEKQKQLENLLKSEEK